MKSPLALLAAGLLLTATSSFAAASAPAHPGSLPILTGLDSVRKELNVTPSQAKKLDAIRAGLKSKARSIVASAGTTTASKKKAAEALVAANEAANAQTLAVLTPAQITTLNRIEHQKLGGTMLLSPVVQKDLNLSPSQIQKIEKIRLNGLSYLASVNQRFESGELSHQERLNLLRSYRLNQADKLTGILNPAQKKALKCLAGKSCQA